MSVSLLLMTLTLLLVTSAVTPRPLEVKDLTYTLGNNSVFWPGQPPFNFTILLRGHYGPSQIWWEANAFGLGEHGGTHIDAPAHFAKGRWRTHQIPASHLVGPGLVLDVSQKVKDNERYAVTAEDFMNWEAEHGQIPQGAVVLINFGWGERYPDPKRVFNTEYPEDPTTYVFPGMHPDAARWLVDNRKLTALGVDTSNPDLSNVTDFPVHTVLLASDILILEFVANLDTLPPRGFDVIIGIVKLEDGSGGPARILGLMGSGSDTAIFANNGFPRNVVMIGAAVMTLLWRVSLGVVGI